LINLLTNAIKFTKEGIVSISITCKKDENHTNKIIASVRDTGTGVYDEKSFKEIKRVPDGLPDDFGRYALYINFVLVAPPPFAASKSSPTMSLLLLYFSCPYCHSI